MPLPSTKSRLPWVQRLAARFGYGKDKLDDIDRADQEYGTEAYNGGHSSMALSGNGVDPPRTRAQLYQKWQSMITDPLISSALRLHCTAALGGHESTGDVVFIEKSAEAEKNDALGKLVDELRADLGSLMNRMAYPLTFNAVSFGDGYARIYPVLNQGVVDASVDQMCMPALIQPYMQGSATVGFVAYIGQKGRQKLTPAQMIRMEMPRTIYTPQPLAVEMAWRAAVTEDDPTKLPVMPAIAGGSFLDGAEEAYDRYISALISLVAKRSAGSVDAAWLKVNLQGMTKEQQDAFLESVTNGQNYYKAVVRQAIATKKPVIEPLRLLLPVSDEKQVMAMETMANTDTGQGYTIDDVMLHAKLLGGALGADVSQLGFADLLSGGFGDGGFNRTSISAAERSRMIRVALDTVFNHLVDIHLLYKKRITFPAGKRPWKINFYSTIASLEAERQKTKTDEMNTGAVLIGMLSQLKDIGLPENAVRIVLGKSGLSEEDASALAVALSSIKPDDESDPFAAAIGGPRRPAAIAAPAEG